MLYLVWAILCSVGLSLIMRLGVERVKNNITMLAVSYLSCTLLGLLHTLSGGARLYGEGMGTTVLLSMIAGVLLLAGFVFLQWNVHVNGVVLSGVFSKLGVLVPTAVSIVRFGERPALMQIIGFVLAVAAILLIDLEKSGTKAGSRLALLLLLLTNGSCDAMSKVYEELGSADLQECYLLLSFFAAFLLSLLLAVCKKQGVALADVGWGLLLGVPNYYCSRFLIKALGTVPAVAAYPTYSVGTIVVLTAAGVMLFHERITARQKLAMVIILAALVLLNM